MIYKAQRLIPTSRLAEEAARILRVPVADLPMKIMDLMTQGEKQAMAASTWLLVRGDTCLLK